MRSIAVFVALSGFALEIHAAAPIGQTIWLHNTNADAYVKEDSGELRAQESNVGSAMHFEVESVGGSSSDIRLKVAGTDNYVKLDTSDNILKPNGTVADIDGSLTHFTWSEVTDGITLTSLGKQTDPIVKASGSNKIIRANSATAGSSTIFTWEAVDPVVESPDAPVGLVGFATDSQVELDWDGDTLEAPAQYTVYRSTNEGVTAGNFLATTTESTYTDTSVTNGEIYYYAVSVSDDGSNESELSEVVSEQPIEAAPAGSPNIIFFIADDYDKEGISCYGGNVYTPNLQKLADEGILMDAGHVVSNVCATSRYSMMTGRYPGNSKMPSYLNAFPEDRHGSPEFNVGLEDDNMNVGNVLRLAGYV
ncbi:MAG: sulfatase-like hydrolase/transferase, partial [Coraliomargarita sp.]